VHPIPTDAANAQPTQRAGSAAPAANTAAPTRDTDQTDPPAMAGQVSSARETLGETDMDAIRREGLTGRQLRMARRIAQKHNLPATSDFDAVRLLREQGLDPFKRSNMLELVMPQAGGEHREGGPPDVFAGLPATTGGAGSQLPQTVPAKQTLPSTELSPAETRTREIGNIQRDIANRRRRKLWLLMVRLAFFVMLPTFAAGWYFYMAATPMYATKSEFLILQADNAGGSGLGGLLSGTQFATNQDAIAVQSYLQSKDAMLRLDRDVGFKSHFKQPDIDPIQRLNPEPSNEEAYRTFKKNVKIGYDPTEGVVRMEVIAADPNVSTEFSKKLISYAEERVNNLTQQKRGDQMADAMTSFENAENQRREAQRHLVDLQVQGAMLDPEAAIASIRSQMNSLEGQLQEKQLQLAALLDNARPNQSRVDGARADIRRYEKLLADLSGKMTDVSQGENSLAALSVNIQMAQADLATRDMLLQSALQQVEQTRMEANRQVRYLTISVQPVPSEEPSYPRSFENTVLAFLIFGGIYLMISLTASILREQVTS
jgi:capsular polysaccharide transport system permease protein